MSKLINKPTQLIRVLKNRRGQTLVEYGLLLVLIAVVVIAAVTLVGEKTSTMFSTISTSLP